MHLNLLLAGEVLWGWPARLMLLLGVGVLLACLGVFVLLVGRVYSGRGKVWVEPFGLPDIFVTLGLMGWLGALVQQAYFRSEKAPLTDAALMGSVILYGLIVLGLALFLRARHISVVRLFGLAPGDPIPVLKKGALLAGAVMPIVFACSLIVQEVLGPENKPQEIVQYFMNAAAHSDWGRVVLAAVFAIGVAPVMEEFIFRGYFYGVLRRYTGCIPALLITSLLFALVHVNLAALLPLLVLAGCLTLAYEATGSLLTPMVMHAIFNALMLALMFLKVKTP